MGYVKNVIRMYYDMLVKRGYEVVGVFLYGSQNYGLHTSKSDVDAHAIILPTLMDLAYQWQPKSIEIEFEQGKCAVHDIRKAFNSIRKQGLDFLQILWTPYNYINPKYEKLFKPMIQNRGIISHYDVPRAIKGMSAMAKSELERMTRDSEIVAKYGYDAKKLSNILRLLYTLTNYVKSQSDEFIMLSDSQISYLRDIRTHNIIFDANEAMSLANSALDNMETIVKPFIDKHSPSNDLVQFTLDSTQLNLMKKFLQEEVLR